MTDNRVDSTLAPVYLLRSYAWKLLKNNYTDVWDEANYGGKTPMVPLAELPELSEYSGPHIVYGYALDGTGSLPARKSGSMTFAIYDTNFRRLTKTLNILQTAFERQDEAARHVNAYTSNVPEFLGVTFAYINIGFIEGGTPAESEGGRQSALLNIRFEYHADYDVEPNPNNWTL